MIACLNLYKCLYLIKNFQFFFVKVGFDKERSPTTTIANMEFPAKRERGTLGRKIRLRTNHYRIDIRKPFTVYQYDLEPTYVGKEGSKPRDSTMIFKNKELMK